LHLSIAKPKINLRVFMDQWLPPVIRERAGALAGRRGLAR
jgi:hypothetical protein